jgi:hypothetical protein
MKKHWIAFLPAPGDDLMESHAIALGKMDEEIARIQAILDKTKDNRQRYENSAIALAERGWTIPEIHAAKESAKHQDKKPGLIISRP